jgi:nucleoside-diphosphate kinase
MRLKRAGAAPLAISPAVEQFGPVLYNSRLLKCRAKATKSATKSTEFSCRSDFPMERTLVLLKPDCVQRRLMGRVISRFEEKGLNIIAMKMLKVSPDLAKQHYAEHVSKPFYPGLEKFITASPILAMVVEGLEVIRVVREMLGATSGLKAAAGTIRGDYSSSRQMNLVHASDGPEAASREIGLYFKSDEILPYEPTLVGWLKADDEN